MFWDKIGSTMEVYIKNMVVKRRNEGEHVANLAEMFEILR